MSETSGVSSRSRRRAVRSEGPPPEEVETASQALDTSIPVTATAATDKVAAGAGADSEVSVAPVEVPAPAVAVIESAPVGKSPAAAEPVQLDKSSDAAPAADPQSDESEAPAVASAQSGNLWMKIVAAVCIVISVAALGASGYFLYQRNQSADLEAQRTEYTQFASQAMTIIVNINGDSAPADFAKALTVTSGDFAADLAKRKDEFSQLIQKAQVKVKGEVVATALESSDEQSAIVLVAVKQSLTNAGVEGEQQRQYRFRVTLTRDGDHLSVTGMEMVF